jgi:glutamyl-Q tRNA(Asp) synthetase
MSQPVLRFAPSPNGYLHLGHALSALECQRWANALGGRLLLRIEDTDLSRARPQYVEAILDDLAWLGLTWEEPVRVQSDHLDTYDAVLRGLYAQGLAYPAPASRTQIARALDGLKTEGIAWGSDPDGSPHYPFGERDRATAPMTCPRTCRSALICTRPWRSSALARFPKSALPPRHRRR